MTSNVSIVFTSPKTFTVSIDSIESISPRGLELAFAKVMKEFAGHKGRNKTQRLAYAKEIADAAVVTAQETSAADALFEEELSKFRETAKENVNARLESLDADELRSVAEDIERKAEVVVKQKLLDVIEEQLMLLADNVEDLEDLDLDEAVTEILTPSEDSPEELDEAIEDATEVLEKATAEGADSQPTKEE